MKTKKVRELGILGKRVVVENKTIEIENLSLYDVYPKPVGSKGFVIRRVQNVLAFDPSDCSVQFSQSGWLIYSRKDFKKICEMHGIHIN